MPKNSDQQTEISETEQRATDELKSMISETTGADLGIKLEPRDVEGDEAAPGQDV